MAYRTRFAPSPTGFLHVGSARTALFAWLVAKQSDGQFILRIEDTDKTREQEGAYQHILDSLKWLGLEWDEGPDKGGPHGPYRQSERLAIYHEWAAKLAREGKAYPDGSSAEQVESWRQAAKNAGIPFLFRNHRPENPLPWDGKLPLRLKSTPKPRKWHDEVMGDLSAGEEAIDDFILIKADGYPTYNFAHIIDDELMKMDFVIRTQEFLASVPRFLDLYDALGFKAPKLATLPFVLGESGKKKMSKREDAKDILDYQKNVYLPEALVNFLATLGWNDGTENEIYSLSELKDKFSLDRVGRSGAQFDEQRLVWLNGHYIRQMPIKDLSALAAPFWPKEAGSAEEIYKQTVLLAVQERLKYLAELPQLTSFFFVRPSEEDVLMLYENPTDKGLKNLDREVLLKHLKAAATKLEGSDFSSGQLQPALNKLLDEQDSKPAELYPVMRIALTGSPASPEIHKVLEVLGKDESIFRLDCAIKLLEQ